MRLPDGPRQIIAALASSGAFLVLYFGASLVWWLSLGLAFAIYFAFLLIVERRPPLDEIQLSERVSAADIEMAAIALKEAGVRLTNAAARAPETDRPAINDMARNVFSIRERIIEDPEDFRPARRFITIYLPKIVQTVESYAKLTGQATTGTAERVSGLGAQIRSFVPVIERINAACIENDLRLLEVEVEVLSGTLDHA